MKTCKTCKIEKEQSFFYAHPKTSDRLDSSCKDCRKEKVRLNRIANHDYYSEYDKKRFQNDPRVKLRHDAYKATDHGRAIINKCGAAWIAANPKKKAASTAVGNAVRDGKLTKRPCEICGSTIRTHGHHDDYDKVYDVRWLCPQHHMDWHKEHGEALNPR